MRIARESKVDFLLAVGGGSCCDYAKAVAVSVNCDEDAWDRYFLRYEDVAPGVKVVPLGCVLTMAGTSSEMNSGSVITDPKTHLKIGKVFAHQARLFDFESRIYDDIARLSAEGQDL